MRSLLNVFSAVLLTVLPVFAQTQASMSGVNTVTIPGLVQLDFSVHKQFQIVENQALQFRFEAFNLPNHPNWGKPDITRTSSSFGKIRSTRTNMREIQVALKYMF